MILILERALQGLADRHPVVEANQILRQHQHRHTHQRQGHTQLLLVDSAKPLRDLVMLSPTETHAMRLLRQAQLIIQTRIPD